jgi:hypothetical protein
MSLLSAQYEKETGKPCCGLMCHVIAPTSEYANWLEDEVKKLTAHNSQSDAIALCCRIARADFQNINVTEASEWVREAKRLLAQQHT